MKCKNCGRTIVSCPACGGKGSIWGMFGNCSSCGGSGYVCGKHGKRWS